MSALVICMIVVGLLASAIGVRIGLLPVSERMLDDVASSIEGSTGEPPARSELRESIERDRRRLGAAVLAAGVAIIAVALLM